MWVSQLKEIVNHKIENHVIIPNLYDYEFILWNIKEGILKSILAHNESQ